MKTKPRKRIGRLKTASDIARYIARCIKASERDGGTKSTTHYKHVMMASLLLKAIEVSTLEDRIAKLEENIAGVKQR